MRLTRDNHSFRCPSAPRCRGRLVKQGIGFVAVVSAGLLMSIAPRLLEGGMDRGGLVLFGYSCYVFGVRLLFQSRRLSAAEREEAIHRLTECQDEWLSSPGEDARQQLSSLAQAVVFPAKLLWPNPRGARNASL